MKTRHRDPSQLQPEVDTSAVPPEDEETRPVEEPIEQPEPIREPARDNPWRSMDSAPKDRIISGRFSTDDEVGRPIRWRNSRHRGKIEGKSGFHWIPGGVWHAAETAGAVQLHPIEWREWEQTYYHFPEVEPAEAA